MKQTKTLVALVEDDPLLLRAVCRLISLAGYRVLAFDRREKVLRARLPKHRGCIVLDVFMPGMDAVEFFHRLRADGNQLPIILITGRQDEHSQSIIAQIDCAAVLYKPFTAAELLQAIGKSTPRAL
jgi:FixJ family two-component response regulator